MTIKQQGGIFGRNPTFNNVDVEGTLTVNGEPISDFGTMAQQDANAVAITGGTASLDGLTVDTNTLVVDAASNKVGIGNSSPYTLLELSSTDPVMRFNDTNGGVDTKNFEMRYVGTSSPNIDGLYFRTVNDANNVYSDKMVILGDGDVEVKTGNLVISTSGNGIDFSATSGTGTSELFDDYEEGNWTASLANDGTTTYTSEQGTYTKIGRRVFYSVRIIIDTEDSGATSATAITGLPFTSASGMQWSSGCIVGDNNWDTSRSNLVGYVSGSSTQIEIKYNSGTNLGNISVNDIGSGGYLFVSGSYEV